MRSTGSMERGKGGSRARDRTAHPGVLALLFCLLCCSSVVVPTAVVFFIDMLRVTHQLAIFIKPRSPRLPDALVLLHQSVPGREIPVRQLTSKRGGIPE